jgi:hypothetical protein
MEPAVALTVLKSDSLLVEAAQDGDLQAFDDLARRHYPRVFSLL